MAQLRTSFQSIIRQLVTRARACATSAARSFFMMLVKCQAHLLWCQARVLGARLLQPAHDPIAIPRIIHARMFRKGRR